MSELRQRKGNADDPAPQTEAQEEDVSKQGKNKNKETRGSLSFFLAFFATVAVVGAGALYVNGGLSTGNSIGRLMTPEELTAYDGKDESKPVYLALLGKIYDVSTGEFYRGEGGYTFFAGKDASRAFVTGEFTGEPDDSVAGLKPKEVNDVFGWLEFYRDHETYTFVGTVVGRYYDKFGQPTQNLKDALTEREKATVVNAELERIKLKYPYCNSRWNQNDGGLVWCVAAMLKHHVPTSPLVPRKYTNPIADGVRCACVETEHADAPEFEVYDNCEPGADRCVTSPPQKPAA